MQHLRHYAYAVHAHSRKFPIFLFWLSLTYTRSMKDPALAAMSNEFVGDTKWYSSSSSLFIDQSMLHDKVKESTNRVASVFAVATMWHENSDEMLSILESIFRMDKDQSLRRSDRYHNTNKVMELRLFRLFLLLVIPSSAPVNINKMRLLYIPTDNRSSFLSLRDSHLFRRRF